MKRINILLASALAFIGVNAQSYNPVSTEYTAFSDGEKEVFKVVFNQVNQKQVDEAVKDYLKNYKAKLSGVKGVKDEYTASDLKLTNVNNAATNMVLKTTELEGNATLYVHYLVDGKIVSEKNTPSEFEGYEKFTEAIANKATYIAYDAVLKTQNKVVSDKESDLKNLEKDEKKAHDSIGDAKKSIKDSETALSGLEKDLSNQKALVLSKKQEVEAKKAEIASVNVKTLESDIKTLEKENSSIAKDIAKNREEIAKTNGEIAIQQTNLETLRKTIDAQKQVLAVSADKKQLKEVQSLEKDEAKLIGGIEEQKGSIANTEAAIATKETTIETNKAKIAAIQSKINTHSEDALKDQLKVLEKDLSSLEKEESGITKNIGKNNSNITSQEENIRQANAEIEKLKTAQADKKKEIDTAKEAVKNTETEQGKYK